MNKLYNDKGVSNIEAMTAARHNSVSASSAYVERNVVSEAARFKALADIEVSQNKAKQDYSMTTSHGGSPPLSPIIINPYSSTMGKEKINKLTLPYEPNTRLSEFQ